MSQQHESSNTLPIADIEAHIDGALKSWNVPGGAVAILNEGEVISSKGYGVTKLGTTEKVNSQTLFPIGSCTKAFTAAALGMLVDEGKLSWDDKIIRHLPDFCLPDPWVTQEITLRDMLCHRSGLMRAIRLMNRQANFDSRDYRRRMRYLRSSAGFREKFGYNNSHFIISGSIIEAVSGQTWEDFIAQRIFKPLGMSSSFTSYQKMLAAKLPSSAHPHASKCDLFFPPELCALEPVQPIPWTDYGENPAGSIISSLDDLTIWLRFLMNQGSFDGQQLINPATIAEMTRPQMIVNSGDSEMDMLFAVGIPTNFMTYGLGWYVSDYRGEHFVFHPGQLNGFVAAIAYMPARKIGGIIVLNTYQTLVHPMIGYYLIDALLGYKSDYCQNMFEMVQQWSQQAAVGAQQMLAGQPAREKITFDTQSLCGKYESDLFGEVYITAQNDCLKFQYGETTLYQGDLEHWQGHTFVIRYQQPYLSPEFLTFQTTSGTRIQALEIENVDIFQRVR